MTKHLRASRDECFALAVDLGSSVLKVGVVSLAGAIGPVEETPLESRRLEGGGEVQDAEQWWRLVRESAHRVVASVGGDRVAVVSCTSQWASTVPVDASGEPVGPCLMWLDTRGAEHSRRVVGGPLLGYSPLALLTWVRHTAGVPSPAGGDPLAHMLHLQHDEPEVAAAARWFIEPCDYLTMRFTGRAAATHASMCGAWLTDNRRLDRLEYDRALVRRAGIDASKLPPLVATGSIIGSVRGDVAEELGLGPDVPVVSGTPDLHSAALGTGAAEEGQPHMTISTTSWISLPVSRKRTDTRHSIATVPGLDANGYLVVDNQEAAGRCLRWLRERALAAAGPPSFAALIELAESAPPGAGGVIFAPWIAGERSPVDDRRARGGWHNVSARTTGPDLIRALLEGVALNSRWLLGAVERFAGRRLETLRLFGGGAVSDLWCQIHADVLDRRIERVGDPLHTNLRGAALFAALALGAADRGEVRGLVPVEHVFEPEPSNRAAYDRLYGEFPGLYKAQRKMFARLNRGGPPAGPG